MAIVFDFLVLVSVSFLLFLVIGIIGTVIYLIYGGNNHFAAFRFEELSYTVHQYMPDNKWNNYPQDTTYYLTISSDSNVAALYNSQKFVNIYMICPLTENTKQQEIGTEYPVKIYGSFMNDSLRYPLERQFGEKIENRYFYKLKLSLWDTSKESYNLGVILREHTACINCRIFMVCYFSCPTDKSVPFCIPAGCDLQLL
jgi:hypothetical protein